VGLEVGEHLLLGGRDRGLQPAGVGGAVELTGQVRYPVRGVADDRPAHFAAGLLWRGGRRRPAEAEQRGERDAGGLRVAEHGRRGVRELGPRALLRRELRRGRLGRREHQRRRGDGRAERGQPARGNAGAVDPLHRVRDPQVGEVGGLGRGELRERLGRVLRRHLEDQAGTADRDVVVGDLVGERADRGHDLGRGGDVDAERSRAHVVACGRGLVEGTGTYERDEDDR
jgi:hypothetical protein